MEFRNVLRQAIGALQLRGLKNSAKWAAEQLAGLSPGDSGIIVDPPDVSAVLASLCTQDRASDSYLLAKTYFDLGEFQRCAFALQPITAGVIMGPNQLRGLAADEVFLKAYALFLAGARRRPGTNKGARSFKHIFLDVSP